jgi:hypothetical protein
MNTKEAFDYVVKNYTKPKSITKQRWYEAKKRFKNNTITYEAMENILSLIGFVKEKDEVWKNNQ